MQVQVAVFPTKYKIYKTAGEKMILENGLLNSLVIEMKTLSYNEIVLLA